jgi:hypothetical protein
VERTRRAVRFARVIGTAAPCGGPSVRAVFGGNLKTALVATQGYRRSIRHGLPVTAGPPVWTTVHVPEGVCSSQG